MRTRERLEGALQGPEEARRRVPRLFTFITRKTDSVPKMEMSGCHHSCHRLRGSTWGGLSSDTFWERTLQVRLSSKEVSRSFMLSCTKEREKWVSAASAPWHGGAGSLSPCLASAPLACQGREPAAAPCVLRRLCPWQPTADSYPGGHELSQAKGEGDGGQQEGHQHRVEGLPAKEGSKVRERGGERRLGKPQVMKGVGLGVNLVMEKQRKL